MVEVVKIMGPPSKSLMGALLHRAPRHSSTLLETPQHSWASLGQSLLSSLLLSSGYWYAQGFVCALQESVSPVLCKFW